MSETTHTPGPWVVRDDGITAAILAGPDEKQIISVTWANGHQSANARLIAAAPDLFKMAKLFLSLGEHPESDPFAQHKILLITELALAAVAKAEGRT